VGFQQVAGSVRRRFAVFASGEDAKVVDRFRAAGSGPWLRRIGTESATSF
jgi:hypothetical protein